MKLDTVRTELRAALERFHKGLGSPIDPDMIEDILWFLDLLRKTQGYDVERPVRKPQRPQFDQAAFEEILRAQRDTWEDLFRYAQGDAKRSNQWKHEYDSSYFWGHSAKEEEPHEKPKQPDPPAKRPWHAVLGVRPDATIQQRQKAYRSLAMKYHPDRGGSHEKMAELNAAKKAAGL